MHWKQHQLQLLSSNERSLMVLKNVRKVLKDLDVKAGTPYQSLS